VDTKHLWLSVFEKPDGKFPILIELRGLNDPTKVDLETYIRATAFKTSVISVENFREFCREGSFIFILDGFDEVERQHRTELERQILQLADDYLDCSLVVTGRPDDRFASWSSFTLYSCLPFEFEQFRELITKVPFDPTSKSKFLKVADNLFFTKHVDFLSNPLLSLMMLMTYRDNAEIPTKLSVFYENCYLTLYSRHDALKEQYRREKMFDQDEFRRVFSTFCFFSYIKSKPQMDEGEIRLFIAKAVEFIGLEASVDDVLHEFRETVNLIQKDGTKYSFIHRSFQEYFAAYCAVNVMNEKATSILSLFSSRLGDSTFRLSYEMHPNLVVNKFFIPEYKKLTDKGMIQVRKTKHKRFESLRAAEFEITVFLPKHPKESGVALSWGSGMEFTLFERRANELFGLAGARDEVSELIFSFHRNILNLSSKNGDSDLPSNLTGSITVSFRDSDIRVSMDLSKNYKRLPKFLKSAKEIVEREAEAIGDKLNESQRRHNIQIVKRMDNLIEETHEKSKNLAAEFGL